MENNSPTQDNSSRFRRRGRRRRNRSNNSTQNQSSSQGLTGINEMIANINRSVSALGIENPQRLSFLNPQPRQQANNFISQTSIPQEQPQQQQLTPEMMELRNNISSRQSILQELGLGDIGNTMNELMQKGNFTSDLEDEAGIGDMTTSLNDIQSQLRETDLNFRRDREDLRDATGMTQGTKSLALNELSSKQARTLADLSVIEATRRDDLATAQSLVDRKVQLHFEPLQQQLQFQQFMFQENKALFNQAEERQFNANLRKEQAAMDKEMFTFKQLENAKLSIMDEARRYGATNQQLQNIQSAGDLDAAYTAAGNNIGQSERLNMQLLRMNINSKSLSIKEQQKKLNELSNPNSTLNVKPDFETATFAKRLVDANQTLSENIPNVGEKIQPFFQFGIKTQKTRLRRQAQENFINAVLRVESGAAIGEDEFEKAAKQYFPRIGDSDEVIAQKRHNREVVEQGFIMQSGGAFEALSAQISGASPQDLLNSFGEGQSTTDFFNDF
jgi:hypothetical protein